MTEITIKCPKCGHEIIKMSKGLFGTTQKKPETSTTFIAEMLERSERDYIPKDLLYMEYAQYCETHGLPVDSKRRFSEEMNKITTIELATMNRQRVRVFKGVKRKGEIGRDEKEEEITAFRGDG